MSGQFEPVKLRSDQPVAKAEREPFFSLDDAEYTILKHVPPAMTLRFIDEAARNGEAAAFTWIMRELVGDEAADALQDSDSITDDQMATLMGYIQKKALAATKKHLGNSSGGRRR